MFPTERLHFERMFQEVLSEKTVAKSGNIEVTRCPLFDEATKRLLTEPAIQVICEYEDELRNSFVAYFTENYSKPKLLLTWKEIALQHGKMSTFSFLLFLKESAVVPNVLSVETVNDCMMKMVPASSGKEMEFYHKHMPVVIYEKQIPDGSEKPVENDPQLEFHEFQLCLARIAFELHSKDSEKKDLDGIMERFFGDIIGFRQNDRVNVDPFPNINKKLFRRLENYYRDIESE